MVILLSFILSTAGKIAIKNMLNAEQTRAKFKKKREEERRISQWRYDIQKYDHISTHFQFNEYSRLTIALSGYTDEENKINLLLLLDRVFSVPRF